jgi:hypothetical protein
VKTSREEDQMKSIMTNQRYLKAFLLLALAANISWKPMMKQLKSVDLAQTSPTGERMGGGAVPSSNGRPNGGQAAPQPTGATPEQQAEILKRLEALEKSGLSAQRNQAVQPTGTGRSGAPLPVSGNSASRTEARVESDGSIKLCKMRFRFDFKEETEGGKTETKAHAYRLINNGDTESAVYEGTVGFDGSVAVAMQKRTGSDGIDARLISIIKQNHKSECADETKTADRDDDKRSVVRRETDVRECRVDKDGDRISDGTKKIKCLLDNMVKIAADSKSDDRRDRRDSAAYDDIKDLIKGPLTSQLKPMLVSSDKSTYEDGRDMLKEAIATVKGLKSDLGSDHVNRLLASLDALEQGANVDARSRRYLAEEEELRKKVDQTWDSFSRRPNAWTANQLYALERRHDAMQREIFDSIEATSVRRLDDYQRENYITSENANFFLGNYLKLSDEMSTMFDTNRLNQSLPRAFRNSLGNLNASNSALDAQLQGRFIAPSDLSEVRARVLSGAQSVSGRLGIQLPLTAPSLNPNLGNLGLQTPLASKTWGQNPGSQNLFAQQGAANLGLNSTTFANTATAGRILPNSNFGVRAGF